MKAYTDTSAFPAANERGMTLRDYFAAKAMQEIISNNGDFLEANYGSPEIIAHAAYHMADVMLLARDAK